MKWILSSATFVFATSVLASTNPGLDLEYASRTAIVPMTGTSCSAAERGETGDIPSSLFSLREFTVVNATTSSFEPMAIQIDVKDNGSVYKCTIAGDELKATGLSASIEPQTASAISCSITCGGVHLKEDKTYAADLIVTGILKGADGSESSATVQGNLEVVNFIGK